jgi:hypothetical protein
MSTTILVPLTSTVSSTAFGVVLMARPIVAFRLKPLVCTAALPEMTPARPSV